MNISRKLAGRDGVIAQILLLASEPTGWIKATDHQRGQYFDQQQQILQARALSLAEQLPWRGNVDELRREHPTIALTYAKVGSGMGC